MRARDMEIPNIRRLGKCSSCEQWVFLEKGENFLPPHNTLSGSCDGAGYSQSGLKYVVGTHKEAVVIAKFIRNDNDRCLYRRETHSMMCRDGRDCENTRLLLAKALAEYILSSA